MVVCPGQGSQYPGMLNSLCEKSEDMEWLLEIAKHSIGQDMERLCDTLSEEELKKTENAQLALYFTTYCQYQWLRSHYEVEPQFFAGHSLGEISALSCAGALSIENGLKLVAKRGEYMAQMNGVGKMAAVMDAPEEVVREVCEVVSNEEEQVCIANYNSKTQLIISGGESCVDQAVAKLVEKGFRCIMLKVSGAFHSKYMQEAADQFYPVLKETSFGIFEAPVLWRDIVQYAEKAGVELIIEVGPGHVLKGLIQRDTEIPVLSIGEDNDRNKLGMYLQEKKPGKDYLFLIQHCLGVTVCERNTNFDEVSYQTGVVEVYKS